MKKLLFLFGLLFSISAYSQQITDELIIENSATIGSGNQATANAILDIESDSKGVKFPKLTTTQRDAISVTSSDTSLLIYNVTDSVYQYYSGYEWLNMGGGSSSPLTTKGQIYTYSSQDTVISVGTDGQALLADSSTPTGLSWGSPTADNMATADLTLTDDRTHDLDGNNLTFQINPSKSLSINGITGVLDHSGSINTYGSGSTITARNANNTGDIASLRSFGTGNAGALELSYNGNDYFNINISNGIEMSRYLNPTVKTFRINPIQSNYLQIQDVANSNIWYFHNNGGLGIGVIPTSSLHVQGQGSTDATTALLVENSSSVAALEVTNDTKVNISSGIFKIQPMSAATASALTVEDGLVVCVNTTDATFTSVGIWAYYNAQWNQL